MKKFMLVGCLLSAAMGLNTAFSSSHTGQIEVEFNKNNIYEEFTDEIEIPNSDKYFVNEDQTFRFETMDSYLYPMRKTTY